MALTESACGCGTVSTILPRAMSMIDILLACAEMTMLGAAENVTAPTGSLLYDFRMRSIARSSSS